ncbi:hypothetical protein RI065_10940 [Mycoplasmatota bacterium zrk1]
MNKKILGSIVITIVILALFASLMGIFSSGGVGEFEYISIHGDKVSIYGKGIYKNDSYSYATQAIAQDIVTVLLGIPLLIISFLLYVKESFKGKLLLTGTMGYFLYTYVSYSFLSMYNSLFIIYVILMSLSFFAFVIMMMSFEIESIKEKFKKELPIKFISGFLIFLGIVLALMWLGRIAPSIFGSEAPEGIDHYNTLVIQAMDLGFIVPISLIAGILLINRRSMGYLLSAIILTKGITLFIAVSTMAIMMFTSGIDISTVELVVFPLFTLVAIYLQYALIKNIE